MEIDFFGGGWGFCGCWRGDVHIGRAGLGGILVGLCGNFGWLVWERELSMMFDVGLEDWMRNEGLRGPLMIYRLLFLLISLTLILFSLTVRC